MDDRERPDSHVLLLSTADWDAPLWTNKQYMARELSSGSNLTYVNSLGLRRPRLDASDLRRVVRRVIDRSPASQRPVPSGITVVSPDVIPLHIGATRTLNRRLLRRTVRRWLDDRTSTRVLWTYSPITYGLEADADTVVYHCVDLLAKYPGISPATVMQGERSLAKEGAIGIASSEAVREHLYALGFEQVLYWPNVADVEPFVTSTRTSVRHPRRVVFAGNLTPYKVDLSLLRDLVSTIPDLDLWLIGPDDEGGSGRWKDLDRLASAGVHRPGTLSTPDLADLMATAAVGIIPYALNEYTMGVNPLKLYEYLAAGLAVVSTALPSVVSAAGPMTEADIRVHDDRDMFIRAVGALAKIPSPDAVERRQALAAAHSWGTRGWEARQLVDQLVANS
jgi:glycosyltransferase involved in cell wall biosynthesis